MPDRVETRLGTLTFKDGFPDDATVQKVYDNLDFQRGVQALLTTMPAASLNAMRRGIRSFGPDNQTVIIFESLMDSRSLFLTANTESIYALTWLNLKDGPVVVESPPNTLGLVDDFWFRYVTDLGNAGPDKGKGGKFLFLPPGYKGNVPAGYHVFKSRTFGNTFGTRGFLVNGDPKPGVDSIKQRLRIYPLSQAAKPPATNFVNVSGRAFNTIHSMDFSFFEEVNEVIQEEPSDATDPETLGLLASIGIAKGTPFAPDARMKQILTEAASVGQATARTLAYRTRMAEAPLYPNSAWETPFIGGSYEFLHEGARILDARSFFFFYATGITPAMSVKMVGAGSQYAAAFVDAKRQPLEGGKTYRLHLPPGIPAKDFWSLVVYDNQTRSQLQTDQQFPSIGSQKKGVAINPDTSVDIYFGPQAPPGKENNWVQTWPGKGWNVILRLYGPLQPFFDKTWKPGEIEEMRAGAAGAERGEAEDGHGHPPAITMPDKVETRLGTLKFKDGFPDDATVQKVYDNLDFQRGVQAFLTAMPAASLSAMREGLKGVGVEQQLGRVLRVVDGLEDAVSHAEHGVDLFHRLARPERRPARGRDPAQHSRLRGRLLVPLRDRHGQCRARQGQGRQVPVPAAGLQGRGAVGLLRVALQDVRQLAGRARVHGEWRVPRPPSRASRSISASTRCRRRRSHPRRSSSMAAARHSTPSTRWTSRSSGKSTRSCRRSRPAIDPETLGLLASIGIEKGKPFPPDERMRKILAEAAAVGAATARTITYKSRIKESQIFPNGSWRTAFVGGSYEFLHNGARLLDPYSSFFFVATGITPAMSVAMVGRRVAVCRHLHRLPGRPLDGGRHLQADAARRHPGQGFLVAGALRHADALGAADRSAVPEPRQPEGRRRRERRQVGGRLLRPQPPPGKESNWVQTMPGKGWFVILRLYGPLQPWFDKTWQPGEIEEMK